MNVHDFDLRMVAFNDIRPDPMNIRTKRDRDDDLALKQSILMNGLIEPFVVCEDGKQGYLIVDGHRTHDACREIFDESNPDVPCIVVSQEAGRQFTEGQLRKIRLLKELHTQKLDDWDRIVALRLYHDEMKEMFPDMDDKDIAKSLGKSGSWLSKRLTIHDSGTFATPVSHGKLSSRKAEVLKGAPEEAQEPLIYATEDIKLEWVAEIVKLVKEGMEIPLAIESVITLVEPSEDDALSVLINRVPEDLQERLLDATKDLSLHDTERVVKQVIMGVTVPEAVRAVELKTEIPQGTNEDALTVNDGEGETTTEEAVEKDDDSGRKSLQPSSPETTNIIDRGFEIGGEKGIEEDVLEEATTSPDAELTSQSPLPEEGTVITPDIEPSPETKVVKFVNKMLKLGEATNSHMKENELEGLDDSGYRKLLKDYEEASFAIETFRDFLQGRENNGSVQFNRAKRLHTAIREFDAHSISSVKEATDLRSIKIQTKKKLTEDVNIFDNIINAKGG